MTFRVDSPFWRWTTLAGAIASFVLVALSSTRIWRADHAAAANNLAGFTRAAQLEPGNAFFWYAQGLSRHFDFDHPDPQQAIVDFQRALGDDPRDARTWMDL